MIEKNKRFITIVILMVMVLNFIIPSIVDATGMEFMTYRQLIKLLEKDTDSKWYRPRPHITATINGETATVDGSDRPEDGEIHFTSTDQMPEPHITAKIGDKIELSSASSQVGSGTKINDWDWQVYSPSTKTNKPEMTSAKETTSFTPTEPGIYRVYLNVADNFDLKLPQPKYYKAKFDNWSDLGNWKSDFAEGSGRHNSINDKIRVTDWYFTLMVIEVESGIDIKTDTVISTPQIVTGNKVEIKTVYSIHGVKSEKDKEKFLNMDFDATVKSPLFGEKKYS